MVCVSVRHLSTSDSGWILHTAGGINDGGQVSGSGYHNGQTRGFLLTPQ